MGYLLALNGSLNNLTNNASLAARVKVDNDHKFVGLDAYKHVIELDPPVHTRYRRLLAGLLTLWGVHRIATQFVNTEAGSTGYMAVHAVFITLYFLSTFAVIIMVLERALSTPSSHRMELISR